MPKGGDLFMEPTNNNGQQPTGGVSPLQPVVPVAPVQSATSAAPVTPVAMEQNPVPTSQPAQEPETPHVEPTPAPEKPAESGEVQQGV